MRDDAELPESSQTSESSDSPVPSEMLVLDTMLESIDIMSPDELDRLPWGIIQLDRSGRILNFNAVESRLSSLHRSDAVGKQFFTEVAPCTRVQEFYGLFKEGVIRESLDTSFRFHFAFKQLPRDVTVRLLYSKRSRTVWVIISDLPQFAIGL